MNDSTDAVRDDLAWVAADFASLLRSAQADPALLGGCRPVVLAELLAPEYWVVHADTTVTARGVPAGVLVAERQE